MTQYCLVRSQSLSLDIGPTEIFRGFGTWKKNFPVIIKSKNSWRASVGSKEEELWKLLSRKANMQSVCGHFKWNYTQPSNMHVMIHTPLFDNFQKTWGKSLEIQIEVRFINLEQKSQNQTATRTGKFGNGFASSRLFDTVQTIPVVHTFNKKSLSSKTNLLTANERFEEQSKNDDIYFDLSSIGECSGTGVVAQDKNLQVPEDVQRVWSICIHEPHVLNISVQVFLEIDDAKSESNDFKSQDIISKLRNTCENILSRKIKTDLSIVASNGAVLECHQCFIAVNSSVLAAMLDNNMQESRTSRIELVDVTEECVKALLEYLYTFKIAQGHKNSLLAVELFQVAHKYDIRQLEVELAQILLKRVNSWYDVNAALELFRFARNVEEHKGLKLKCVEVLQLKAEELLNSDNYKKLFNEDLATAMELCAVALKR